MHVKVLRARFLSALLASMVASFALTGVARSDVIQPQRGEPLRREIMDAVRPTFELETGGPIEFVIRRLNVLHEWAFGDVQLQRPGGGAIDWSATKYAEDNAQGMFDPAGTFFLLRRAETGWVVVEFSTGPTDVVWDGWRQDHKLPQALFER